MKLSRQLVLSSLAVFVLSACSSSPTQRRQAKDDFEYLNTAPLKEWQLADDAKPQFYTNYKIPQGDFQGGIGHEVDIRPPQQILELIPGARVENKLGETTLWLLREDELNKVWQTALTMLNERNISLREQSESKVVTDWVVWTSEDEDTEVGARYEINKIQEDGRYGFQLSLVDWQQGGDQKPVTLTNKERYNTLMTNLVTARYDLELREEAARKAQELVKYIPITMGSDRSGFPVIIARTSYDTLWPRLPKFLTTMGFTLEERNQSQGTVKAKYSAPDDEFWTDIGVKPMELKSGVYTFLLGDLGNRTSINVTDSSGKPVEEQLLKDMAPVISAVIEREN